MEPERDDVRSHPRGFVRREVTDFWAWYERNYRLNVGLALFLFAIQLVHLAWLGLDVVAGRLTGTSLFPASGLLLTLLVLVDLLEIPALLSVSLIYVNELRQGIGFRPILYLALLNSQWLHILWITDEFVVDQFTGSPIASWPVWLAWVAIAIDYLELPVMFDTARRFVHTLRSGGSLAEIKEVLTEDDLPGAVSVGRDDRSGEVPGPETEPARQMSASLTPRQRPG